MKRGSAALGRSKTPPEIELLNALASFQANVLQIWNTLPGLAERHRGRSVGWRRGLSTMGC